MLQSTIYNNCSTRESKIKKDCIPLGQICHARAKLVMNVVEEGLNGHYGHKCTWHLTLL